ncbi:MAG: hypothetical protein Q8L79_17325 [Methylobacter sp.]|uniref:hypothetical protein n=1 Tax=Methylobacter sp. TaxID=2051955 RepID=UPI00272F53E4|nr:hypothetical protein [Methylobacter sp.]MDP1666873.1 hypothetical protein [Methylobacter sp.]
MSSQQTNPVKPLSLPSRQHGEQYNAQVLMLGDRTFSADQLPEILSTLAGL